MRPAKSSTPTGSRTLLSKELQGSHAPRLTADAELLADPPCIGEPALENADIDGDVIPAIAVSLSRSWRRARQGERHRTLGYLLRKNGCMSTSKRKVRMIYHGAVTGA